MSGHVERTVAFAAAALAGVLAALVCFWGLMVLDGGALFAASLVHPEVVLAVALACGALLGLATASGASGATRIRRGVACAGALLLLGIAAFTAFQLMTVSSARAFDAERFRAANAAGDLDALEREASRAVKSGALLGLSRAQLHATLGEPARVGRRNHVHVWHLGMINDFMGPGDGGSLFVEFDPSWRRVVSARVDTAFE